VLLSPKAITENSHMTALDARQQGDNIIGNHDYLIQTDSWFKT